GFGHEGDDVATAEFVDLGFELLREALRIVARSFVRAALAIFVDRRDVMRLDQQRLEWLALPLAAADRQRAERHAMLAVPPRYDVLALRLAALDEVLAGGVSIPPPRPAAPPLAERRGAGSPRGADPGGAP